MTVNVENTSIFHAPQAFIDERGSPFVVELLKEKRNEDMMRMYMAYEPRNSFNGLPPLTDKACTQWVRQMIQTGVNLVAVSFDYGMVGHAALFFIDEVTCELFLVVSPQHQRVGIGTELTRCAIQLAYEVGSTKLWLSVEADNKVAQHVYRKCGFKFVRRGQWEREMILDLSIYHDSLEKPVSAILKPGAVCIHSDTSCLDAVHVILREHVSALPVVDAEGKVAGIVTATDLLAFHCPEEQVAHILTRGVITVHADCAIKIIIRLLQTNKLRCIPITDSDGRFIGIVGRHEVLTYYLDTVLKNRPCVPPEVAR